LGHSSVNPAGAFTGTLDISPANLIVDGIVCTISVPTFCIVTPALHSSSGESFLFIIHFSVSLNWDIPVVYCALLILLRPAPTKNRPIFATQSTHWRANPSFAIYVCMSAFLNSSEFTSTPTVCAIRRASGYIAFIAGSVDADRFHCITPTVNFLIAS
jgi:hypothetical protein